MTEIKLVDSHCHLDFPELAENLPRILAAMAENGVGWALCAGVTLERFPALLQLAETHDNLFAAVGVHPDHQGGKEPEADDLVKLADHPRVVAIGETGLDYYRLEGDFEWQRMRFRRHIRAARRCGKPLIIHTRSAADDTLAVLREEGGDQAGGVFHCFTESIEVARQALDLGFHISFSGIVTFKNAEALRDVARFVPAERLLVETDSPYLAPVPHRGKTNEPAYVRHVAETLAAVRSMSYPDLIETTTRNFFALFSHAHA
ncbi:MAG: TatD family hydrolase [Rhodocyclaceae bacterium]|jgi:TatD DNase family protein|nr:TatD family hydrolase [Rhodocyclaceae bacterium]